VADRRISELSVIPAVAGDDALAIVDTSLSETNKVSVEDLLRSAPAGTAAAPSIAFVDDPDSGFYRSAANELSISTSGSQRVVVKSTGNVGIGTSSPSQKLHIESTGSNAVVNVNRTDAATAGVVQLGAGSGANFITSTGDKPFFIATNNTERLRILGNGNVGIGTSSPDSAFHAYKQTNDRTARFQRISTQYIDVEQNASVNRISGTGKSFYLGSTDANPLILETAATERMRIDSAGNVGIGTSNPVAKLEVAAGGVKSTDGYLFGSTSSYLYESGADTVALRVGSDGPYAEFVDNGSVLEFGNSGGSLALTSSGSERMRITSAGNVGIGTSSPTTDLTVQGYVLTGRNLGETDEQLTSVPSHLGTNITPNIQVNAEGGDSASISLNHARSNNNGIPTVFFNKAFGDLTTPLAVNDSALLGAIVFNGYDGTNYIGGAQIRSETDGTVGTNDMPARLEFLTTADGASSPTERMRITSAGSVGIGTSNPEDKLHVSGNARLEGSTPVLTFRPALDTQQGRMNFINTAGTFKGRVGYDYGSDYMTFFANATEHMRIRSNGVINFANCPTYADDTAAGTGGLVAGDVYKTSTGELRIKL
jgi:hypothetical protein